MSAGDSPRLRRPIGFAGLTAATVVLSSVACTPPDAASTGAHIVERSRLAMGSELRITAWTADETAALSAFEAAFGDFQRLDGLMSVWREGSDVQRLNAAAGKQPVPVSADVREVLRAARQISDWTDGKFDVTFGALSGLWKFDHDQDNRIPDPEEVGRHLSLIDYGAVDVNERAGTVFLRREGMRVHLGGIGKGYAVDRAVDTLRQRGLSDFMIQSGGDMYVAGRRGERPWRVGIRDPRGPADRSYATLDLSEGAITTAGDYERFFVKEGRRYHHILDPDSGEPARGCRSVTIVTGRATLADGLATGVFVLGPGPGMALIERLPGVEGVIVTDKNEVLISSGLKDRLMVVGLPTDAP
jgi:thiamine biosynthesis lipoprotein